MAAMQQNGFPHDRATKVWMDEWIVAEKSLRNILSRGLALSEQTPRPLSNIQQLRGNLSKAPKGVVRRRFLD
jgi:hypothetical protein